MPPEHLSSLQSGARWPSWIHASRPVIRPTKRRERSYKSLARAPSGTSYRIFKLELMSVFDLTTIPHCISATSFHCDSMDIFTRPYLSLISLVKIFRHKARKQMKISGRKVSPLAGLPCRLPRCAFDNHPNNNEITTIKYRSPIPRKSVGM